MIECVHNTKSLTDVESIKLLEILKKRWRVSSSTEAAYEKCLTGGYLILNNGGIHICGYDTIPRGYSFNIINASSLLQISIKYNKDLK